jgi:hypothetical protein
VFLISAHRTILNAVHRRKQNPAENPIGLRHDEKIGERRPQGGEESHLKVTAHRGLNRPTLKVRQVQRFGLNSDNRLVKRTLVELVRERWAAGTTNPIEISFARRCGLWMAAWAGAAVASVIATSSPIILLFAWNFPVGLPGLIDWDPAHPSLFLTLGWVFYIGLTFYALRRRDRGQYFLLYAILLVVLAINVGGCKAEISHIHIGC